MALLLDAWPWLLTMVILIGCSAFFSGCEAGLFYLRWNERRDLQRGNRYQQMAAALLENPDRLLSSVLLWNLAINMTYFAIASKVGLLIRSDPRGGSSGAVLFAALALLTIIFFSEMLPKSLAVLQAKQVATWSALPLTMATRLVDPLLPGLNLANLLSRRLLIPNFQPEPYLDVGDLERAIELSTEDKHLIEQEQTALRNLVNMSSLRVEEWMRPRTQFQTFNPPVQRSDLQGKLTPSGFLLIADPDTDEVTAALNLKSAYQLPPENLERLARPIIVIPWCVTVGHALEQLEKKDREVGIVVDEFGETIGLITLDDILDTVYSQDAETATSSRSIREVGPGHWQVSGTTSLRRVSGFFSVEAPVGRSVTVAGMMQEQLHRLLKPGDQVVWDTLQLQVVAVPLRGAITIEITLREQPS